MRRKPFRHFTHPGPTRKSNPPRKTYFFLLECKNISPRFDIKGNASMYSIRLVYKIFFFVVRDPITTGGKQKSAICAASQRRSCVCMNFYFFGLALADTIKFTDY